MGHTPAFRRCEPCKGRGNLPQGWGDGFAALAMTLERSEETARRVSTRKKCTRRCGDTRKETNEVEGNPADGLLIEC